MAQPAFMPEGTAPALGDTQLRAWKKILGVLQNLGGALSANNPSANDTMKVTKEKIVCSEAGTSYGA